MTLILTFYNKHTTIYFLNECFHSCKLLASLSPLVKYLRITFINTHKTREKTILFSNSTFFRKQNYIILFLHQTALNDFSRFQSQIQISQIHSQKIQSAIHEAISKDRQQTLKFIKKVP